LGLVLHDLTVVFLAEFITLSKNKIIHRYDAIIITAAQRDLLDLPSRIEYIPDQVNNVIAT